MKKSVALVNPNIMTLLMDYHWPGNVRELENIIERAMIVSVGDTLEVDQDWLKAAGKDVRSHNSPSALAELERQAIRNALAASNGKIYGPDGAAAALGVKPTTLYGKIRKHKISKKSPTK